MNAIGIRMVCGLALFCAAALAGAEAPEHEGHAREQEAPVAAHAEEPAGADEHGHEGEEPAVVQLSAEQRRTLGLRTARLEPRTLGEPLPAPGEVRLNVYASAQVSPRVAAQVTARHARLGERVAAGQPLVTLSSVDMAQAQGELLLAEREWQRVRRLGAKVVSERRYLEAETARHQARARVRAYGMTPQQVDALMRAGAAKADGSFALLAPRPGTIIADEFVLGELVEPGRKLFEVTDESVRWVEARLAPEQAARVAVGERARVRYGEHWLEARVSQLHPLLDEATRTRAVRLEVPDPAQRLRPGVFVEVTGRGAGGKPVLALPEPALLRSPDGDWQVFVAESPGRFRAVEVKRLRTAAGLAVIEGLAAGAEVVTEGAFFLQSELAKSGFDIHQH